MSDELVIAGRAFKSRLIVGTGKYRSFPEMARAQVVTRRTKPFAPRGSLARSAFRTG